MDASPREGGQSLPHGGGRDRGDVDPPDDAGRRHAGAGPAVRFQGCGRSAQGRQAWPGRERLPGPIPLPSAPPEGRRVTVRMLFVLKTGVLFVITALAEIVGCGPAADLLAVREPVVRAPRRAAPGASWPARTRRRARLAGAR